MEVFCTNPNEIVKIMILNNINVRHLTFNFYNYPWVNFLFIVLTLFWQNMYDMEDDFIQEY